MALICATIHAIICASKIGIVEQEPFLFSLTVRDNITYGVNRHVEHERSGRCRPRGRGS
jgi:ABC-type bacteriocin/lantibiotic exporter with double-glycine peptidase domain